MVELELTQKILDAPGEDYTRMLMNAVPQLQLVNISQQVSAVAGATPGLEDVVLEAANSDKLLTVSNITAAYGSNEPVVLKDVSLKVNMGETVGIIGESGSDKTTLGRVISGLMPPSKGQLELQGRVLNNACTQRSREDLRQIQFVFQIAETALNPRHRIRQILGRPLDFYLGLTGRAAQDRILELLDLVELPVSFIDRFPRELSGGQLQRISFARARRLSRI